MGKPYPSYQPTRCTAHSKRTGDPCGNWSIRGGNVCRKHGGSAPAVRRRAAERINEASYALAGMLLDIATSATSEAVRLAAIKDALDRAGLRPRDEVSIEVHPWQGLIDRILVDDPGHPAADPEIAAQIEAWNAEAHDPTRDSDVDDTVEAELVEAEPQPTTPAAPAAPVEVASLSETPPARLDPERLAARPPTRPRRRKA